MAYHQPNHNLQSCYQLILTGIEAVGLVAGILLGWGSTLERLVADRSNQLEVAHSIVVAGADNPAVGNRLVVVEDNIHLAVVVAIAVDSDRTLVVVGIVPVRAVAVQLSSAGVLVDYPFHCRNTIYRESNIPSTAKADTGSLRHLWYQKSCLSSRKDSSSVFNSPSSKHIIQLFDFPPAKLNN